MTHYNPMPDFFSESQANSRSRRIHFTAWAVQITEELYEHPVYDQMDVNAGFSIGNLSA